MVLCVLHASVYAVLYTHSSTYKTKKIYRCMYHALYHACIYNHLPEDEPSSSKHVEDIKIKN